MTTPEPTIHEPGAHEPGAEEAWRQQCMLYLLGELNDAEATAFEQRLQASPQLGKALLTQANVIASLSTSALPSPASALPSPASALPCTSGSTASRWPLVASLMAIAAGITMIVLGPRLGEVDKESVASLSRPSSTAGKAAEDLMIARAWASNRLEATMNEPEIADAGVDVDDAIALSSDDSSGTDATLSWMFVAFSVSIDADEARGENDG